MLSVSRLKSRSVLELGVIAVVALSVFALAGAADLHEIFSGWARRHEIWQADELPLALIALCAGLALFAYRRWRDARVLARHNQELARQVIGLRDAECRRIASDLHDHFGQNCNALRVEAACLVDRARDPAAVLASAERIARTADGLYDLVHGLLRELRPAALDGAGLVAAVQALCESSEERAHVDCKFLPSGRLDTLGEAMNIALYRITQEAISNAIRHAAATRVRVTLARESVTVDQVRLRIEDDGRGFRGPARSLGLGLLGMRERAQMLHGRCDIGSARPGGVTVECVLPIPAPQPAR